MIESIFQSLLDFPKGTLLFIVGIINTVWLAYVLYTRRFRAKKLIVAYTLYALTTLCWVFTNAYFQSELMILGGEKWGTFMALLSNIGSGFFFVIFYISCYLKSSDGNISKWAWSFLGVSVFLHFFLNFSGKTVTGIDIIDARHFVLHQGAYAKYWFFLVFLPIIPSMINLILAVKNKQNLKIENKRNLYILVSTMIMYSGCVFSNVIMPFFFNNYTYVWLSPSLSSIEILIVGYSIISRRFHDLQLTAQGILANISNLLIYLFPMFVLFYYFDQNKIALSVLGGAYIFFSLVAIGFWDRSFVFFDRAWSYVFYKKPQTPLAEIRSTLPLFQGSFVDGVGALGQALQVKNSQLILTNEAESYKYRSLFNFFETTNAADLVKDEIDYLDVQEKTSENFGAAKKTMEDYMISAAIPVLDNHQRLLGILLLEKKLNGQLFSVQEIKETKLLLAHTTIYLSKIKNQKKIREKLKNKKKVEKEFMTGLIHEISHPLVVASNIKDMIDWKKLKEEDQEYLLASQNDLHQLSKNLDKVSEVVQWQHGAMSLEKTFGTMEALFQAIQKEENSGEIDIELAESLEKKLFSFDFHRLKQAFGEIIKNAFFFNDADHKKLEIKVVEQEEKIVLTFTDNGIGIQKKYWDKIFDLLFVTAFSRNRSECGFGIGLSIAREIILLHQGSIRVQESTMDEGTTIEVVLKLDSLKV